MFYRVPALVLHQQAISNPSLLSSMGKSKVLVHQNHTSDFFISGANK